MSTITLEEFKTCEGKELSPSEWFKITQEQIDQFAECTGDRQFIHVDPEATKKTPFGSTIAHRFLSLSLISSHGPTDMSMLANVVIGLNYGLNRVRFIAPVKVDSRVRIHVQSFVEKRPPGFQRIGS